MRNEVYFTTYLTENEHSYVEGMIRDICGTVDRNWEMVYYRKFKNGHKPGYRECKIRGGNPKAIRQALADNFIDIGNENKKVVYKGKKLPKWLATTIVRLEAPTANSYPVS